MILVAVKLANEKSEEAGTMLSDALDSLAKFHANCRRLPLRRGWDDPLSAKLAAHQNVVSNLFSYLNDCRTDVEYDDDLANEKLAEIATTRDQLIEVAVPLLGTVDPS